MQTENEKEWQEKADYIAAVEIEAGERTQRWEPPKPEFYVTAYRPGGEEHPVLHGNLGQVHVTFAARRGEMLYGLLLAFCEGKPQWIYSQEPQEL